MTEPEVNPRVLIINVYYDKDQQTTFSKPEGLYDEEYSVTYPDGDPVIHVHPSKNINTFPVSMSFVANVPITAVGFVEDGCGCVPKCTVKGCCGGCFALEGNIENTLHTPLITNHGHKPTNGYRCRVWLLPEGIEVIADPQIYNLGDTEPPPEPDRKRGGWLARLLRKLLDWLER